MKQACSFGLVCALICGALASGCKGDDYYASDHGNDIAFDCKQTIACLQQSGGTLPSGDPQKTCVKDSSDLLNGASDSQRQAFEDTFHACGGLDACQYLDCVSNGAASKYSTVHLADIQNDCKQRLTCRIVMGETIPQSAMPDCVTQTSATLDADATQHSTFENHLMHCAAKMSCDYVNCN